MCGECGPGVPHSPQPSPCPLRPVNKLRPKSFLPQWGLVVGTAPGGSEATLWLVGKGLEPAWQCEKQRRVGSPGLAQQGQGGHGKWPGGPGPFSRPLDPEHVCSHVAPAPRPLRGCARPGQLCRLPGPSCLLGSPPHPLHPHCLYVTLGVSGLCYFRTSRPLDLPWWHDSPQWGWGFMVVSATKP